MPDLDDYITDVLLRDLVGHDRRPASFLVYLWLTGEQARCGASVQISYQELAENIGVSKSSVQAAVSWLRRQKGARHRRPPLHRSHSVESHLPSQIPPHALKPYAKSAIF